MTTYNHAAEVDVAAIVETTTKSRHAPVVSMTPCRCCDALISHLGELTVKMCDPCLDILSGDVEVFVPSRRKRIELENDEAWTPQPSMVEHDPVDVDDIVVRAPLKLRQEIFSGGVVAAEQDSEAVAATTPDADVRVLCATCVNMTAYKCGCGKLCCYECVDAVGKCPSCDGEEV